MCTLSCLRKSDRAGFAPRDETDGISLHEPQKNELAFTGSLDDKKKKSMQDKTVLCMEGLQGEPVYIDQGVNPGLSC